MTDVFVHAYGDSGPYSIFSRVNNPKRVFGAGLGSSVHRVPIDLWDEFANVENRYQELQDAIDACPLWSADD